MLKKAKTKEGAKLICKRCEFYDKKNDCCKANGNIKKCSEQNIIECVDFLVKHKLIFF